MVSAIVLAAGSSTRMKGVNKLLLPFNSSTVIRTTIQQLLSSDIGEVLVVTGFQHERIQAALQDLPVSFVYNPLFAHGMTSSIKAGVAAAQGSAYMICLGDLPAIGSTDYQQLVQVALELDRKGQQFIVLPRYRQARANPVIFSSSFKPAILDHDQPEGCKEIVASNPDIIHWVDMSSDHVLMDIDTRADYEKLLHGNRKN